MPSKQSFFTPTDNDRTKKVSSKIREKDNCLKEERRKDGFFLIPTRIRKSPSCSDSCSHVGERLRAFLTQWQKFTQNIFILEIIRSGYKIEFTGLCYESVAFLSLLEEMLHQRVISLLTE